MLRQDDGVAADEARAHRDHRRQGTFADGFAVGVCLPDRDLCLVVVTLSGLVFQAKEVRRKADQMVQLGKDVNSTPFT